MLVCKFCGRKCGNPGGLKVHENRCLLNPNKKEHSFDQKKFYKNKIAWNKGKKLHYDVWTKGKPGTFKGKRHTEETKRKMSKSKKILYSTGWEPTAGRCPKYDYFSPIAGNIKVDGSWELKFCKFADKKKLNWVRNKRRFEYIKPCGKKSTYQPDFYITDKEIYIEIKGYETDLDHCKWNQFNKALLILRKDEIFNLEGWYAKLFLSSVNGQHTKLWIL